MKSATSIPNAVIPMEISVADTMAMMMVGRMPVVSLFKISKLMTWVPLRYIKRITGRCLSDRASSSLLWSHGDTFRVLVEIGIFNVYGIFRAVYDAYAFIYGCVFHHRAAP